MARRSSPGLFDAAAKGVYASDVTVCIGEEARLAWSGPEEEMNEVRYSV